MRLLTLTYTVNLLVTLAPFPTPATMTVKTKVALRGLPMAYPLVGGVDMQRIYILFLGIVKKIVPNKFASCAIIILLADVTLS